MKRLLLFFTLLIYFLSVNATIDQNPRVGSRKNKQTSVMSVSTSMLSTVVDIDCQQYYLSGNSTNGISFSPNLRMDYIDPKTHNLVSEKAIGLQLFIGGKGEFVDGEFGTKYDFFDFGFGSNYAIFRLLFPHLPSGVSTISVIDDSGNPFAKNLYWKDIQITKIEEFDLTKALQAIDDCLAATESEYAGIYQGVDNNWELVFCQDQDGEYVLVNNSISSIGWNPSDIWGDLKETAYSNVFMGYRYITTDEKITVTFNEGIMTVSTGDSEQTFIRTKGVEGKNNKNSQDNSMQWSGSGFALKNNHIVTNYHVVENTDKIEVYGVGGDFQKGYKAVVVGTDKISDLALLKISDIDAPEIGLPPYYFNNTMAEVGEDVFTLGYPLTQTMGEEVKLTNGIISSRSGFEGDVTTYQISVPIQPGNSGGPLLDYEGNLIGVICAKHTGAENVGYAIKNSYLNNLIESVADPSLLPKSTGLKGKGLKDQVKLVKEYIFLIKCSM